MNHFSTLLDLACGKPLSDEEGGRARRLQMAVAALIISLAFCALWGVAAGSRVPRIAVANLYKVPMVVLVAAVSAVPAGMFAWKLCGSTGRGSDLLLAFATSIFGGTLALAVVAPIVALYYHSSDSVGPVLGLASTFVAIAIGTVIFARGALRERIDARRRQLLVPVTTFAVVMLAMLLQLVAIARPILPESNDFSHGIDHFVAGGR